MALILHGEGDFRERLHRRLRGARLLCETARGSGWRAALIHWYGDPQKIPWRRICALTNRPKMPLLLPPGMELPPDVPLRSVYPEEFYARLTVEAARQCLMQGGRSARRGAVGLLDPAGRALWAPEELSMAAGSFLVYTLRPERYRRLGEQLLQEKGLPLLLAESPAELSAAVLTVAPYPTGVYRVPSPVITAQRSGVQGKPTVNRLLPELPLSLLEELPPGVETLSFLGLAEETGAGRNFHRFPLKECRIDGRRAAFAACCKELFGSA